ncbi:hypothetical protein N7468_006250 [Penicillium chermesinum]|uniref:Altered inheritance of mitochondria protein 9, mitochondrial n=1 Tax=Penicillium chermesinum TaxID=63820 RepID=A0A9W9NRY3_9EURO|nr:uncharacterized protein N7468_006250 [Penicillium chermesinum]KAJ5225025.1 hypothetical protein N7468_006250 [Penicillium chermesinum]KAJ6151754.1 hypothetical protein N7470_006882 [Penicillium chermesinum]
MEQATVHEFDPYSYTSGRWLRNDKRERQRRRIDFHFDELCRKIVGLSDGKRSIKNCEKKEGGFNRVFIFTMDDGSRVVARLPFTLAGPARLATASEVATIQYLQRKTSVPIPKILAWSDDAANSVGSEYIIMEHAAGIQLQQKWPNMSGDQKVQCIDAIYRKLREVVDIEFPAYGSLYLSTSLLGSSSRLPLEGGFCIGPHCGKRYWDCGDGRYYQCTIPNQGPWLTLSTFSDGLIDAGLSRIPPRDSLCSDQPPYQGSIETHLDLLERGRTVLDAMSADGQVQDAAVPTLFHPDLHKRNIFVSDNDPSIITGIIDWQSSSIEPAFWYSDEVPDFATYSPPAQGVDDSELCTKAYEVCTQFLTPKLARPRLMDEGMFRPFRYCYRTWKDGAVAFRHELIETCKDWEALGFANSCPFSLPTPEDMALHRKEYRCFEAAQNLKRDLSSLLDSASDGWVPPENWEVAKTENKAMFKGMLQAVLTNKDPDDGEPIRDERDLRAIWPFDLPKV